MALAKFYEDLVESYLEGADGLINTKQEMTECVVTVPVDSTGKQRSEIRRAMQRAVTCPPETGVA